MVNQMIFPDLKTVSALVVEVARTELLPRFHHVTASLKQDGSIVTEADGAVQTALGDALREHWPDIPLLGEEMPESEQQRVMGEGSMGYWCLDPLDGTSNFAAGIPFFAVSLALVDGEGLRLGVVYDPMRDELYMAERGGDATLNGESLKAASVAKRELARCIAAVDFKRLAPDLARHLAGAPPYASQRNFGACALEWCWLAAGRFQLLAHGGQKFWDYAAGVLVLEQAGGKARTLEREDLYNGRLQARSAVAVRDPELFTPWMGALGTSPRQSHC